MPNEYSVFNGVYSFPGDGFQLRLKHVQRGRFGQLFADVAVLSPDGRAYLAVDRGDLSSGRFRAQLGAQAARHNALDPLRYENVAMAAYIALLSDPDVTPVAPAPTLVRVADFIAGVHPVGPCVVAGLLERGFLYSLASKPKVGKTLLILNLCVAVSTGHEWLGRRVTPGRAILFQLEDSELSLKKRLEAMCGAQWPGDFFLHTDAFRLTPDNYDDTVRACRGASLICVDPIIQAAEVVDWNSQAEVRQAYELWRRLARDTDAGVIAAAHHRKMVGDYGDQLAGSIQAQAAVDGIVELYRDSHLPKIERKLSFTGRDWADLPDEVVHLNTDTLTWESRGEFSEALQEAKEAKGAAKAQEVLDALPGGPPGGTYKELAQATGLGRNQVREAIKALGGAVERRGTPKSSKDPLHFWRRT